MATRVGPDGPSMFAHTVVRAGQRGDHHQSEKGSSRTSLQENSPPPRIDWEGDGSVPTTAREAAEAPLQVVNPLSIMAFK